MTKEHCLDLHVHYRHICFSGKKVRFVDASQAPATKPVSGCAAATGTSEPSFDWEPQVTSTPKSRSVSWCFDTYNVDALVWLLSIYQKMQPKWFSEQNLFSHTKLALSLHIIDMTSAWFFWRVLKYYIKSNTHQLYNTLFALEMCLLFTVVG